MLHCDLKLLFWKIKCPKSLKMAKEFKAKSETLGPQILLSQILFQMDSSGLKAESLVCGSHDLATPTTCRSRTKTLD